MDWFRIFIVIFLFSVMFYYVDVQPIVSKIQNYSQEEKQLKQELLSNRSTSQGSKDQFPMKIKKISIDHMDLIKLLIDNADESGFLLEQIYPKKLQKTGELEVMSFRLVLTGDFSQLNKLIDKFNERKFLLNVEEMVIRNIEKSKIKIEVKIDIFNVALENEKNDNVHNDAFEWIGYMKKNNKLVGLVKMANGDIREVAVGYMINQTSKILRLDTEKMVVKSDKKEWIISYGQAV